MTESFNDSGEETDRFKNMSNSPCAACKCLRRKCTQECAFAPYFPPDQPQRFSNVHKVFGASNVAKLLNDLDPSQREDAVNSLAYEAEARLRDPVYGCVGLISILQHQLKQIQVDLYSAKKELSTYIGPSAMMPLYQPNYHQPNPAAAFGVLQYNMDPMAGPSHVPTMGVVIRDVQAQTPQAQAHAHAHSQAQAPGQPQHLQLHHNAQQFIDAQQQLAAMATREDMEMMRNWEQQQQLQLQPEPEPEPQLQAQQFFRFDSGVGGAYEATTMLASGSNSGIGVGFNQLAGPSGVGSPSLALGGPSIEQNAYHHQIQEDEPQEPLLLLQQPETTLQQQKQGHEDDLGVGQEIPLQFQVLPQLQPSTSHRQLQFQLLHHRQLQHNQQQRPGSEQGISTVDPSC